MARTRDRAADLGTAPVGRLLWHTCSQTTMSVGVYGIYALTNAWFVARGVGATALAGVNLVAPVLLVLGAVSTTVGVGGASLVSRRLGAGDPDGAGRAAGNAFVVFWSAALAITVVGLLAIEPLLTALGARGEARGYARDYAVVLLAGAITATGFSSLVRAEGRMRFSTMLWVVPVLVQIALDPLLIWGLHLGVRGAALGTVGGQAVSAGMSMWFFFVQRDRPYRVGRAELRPHGPTTREVVTLGAPSFLSGFGATVLVGLVNNLVVATGGTVALAAYAVAARVQTFLGMPQVGITQGVQPLIGYNAGAGHWARAVRARALGLRATVGYGALAALVAAVLAGPLVGVFVSDPEIAADGVVALRITTLGLVAAGVVPVAAAAFQALGQARPAYALSIGTLVAIKIPLVLVGARFGPTGVWVALAAGEAVAAVAAVAVLRRAGRVGEPAVLPATGTRESR
ncbi:MATE family efflux transporter [Actinotalea sp. M2MS4P-6]|uniref:MATE family efflux transporter n=1 Tax=Actinotalea sp. M2MS4P-6 TaxID=2983762 RepID=UPI0021E37B84|nr:MATE family efflux transporter [Actinotalea sp. M2MS4P-6]MCV2395697.1 MATE family efflux transporter [Actinotalea sp. M2MS4P-6]